MQASTPTRAPDPRPARTRAAVYAAVAELSSQPGTELTVNAILRASGVSRSGFYANFTGLDDVAEAMLVEIYRDTAAGRGPAADSAAAARAAQERVVTYLDDRRDFLRASLDWPVTSRVHEAVVQAYADGVHAAIDALGDAVPPHIGPDDVEDLCTFIAGGAVALLTRWIREDDTSTPHEVVVDRLLAVMPDWLVGRT